LIRQIYEHCLAQGYIAPGSVVLDPFGGVALGGLDAMANGLHWIGVELEPGFVKLGQRNIELWEHKLRGQNHFGNLPPLGTARIIQGDSRQLCALVAGGGGLVSSPPYASGEKGHPSLGSVNKDDWGKDGRDIAGRRGLDGNYGPNPANLGNLPPGRAPAVVSSPVYAGSMECSGSIDPDKSQHIGGPHSQMNRSDTRYGNSPGQLGAMRDGVGPALVSSPPFEDSQKAQDVEFFCKVQKKYRPDSGGNYPSSKGIYAPSDENIGNTTGTDFWTAARAIMQQVALVLPENAVGVWVCKRFVRNKEIVEFSKQWAALGEQCGFETVEWIRAWLVEDRGAQFDLYGELEHKTVERKSFFRRLAERKGSPRIDWEDVIIQRRRPA
jgi:hypothetical protein